ncbi:hypothetical protein L3Q82_012315 [Scortum barcoo]|uniref:Uncharacterized protein n=1 Tax=Scortum barcoo TaxID=214431 RepID=A0ACB8W265_9TELE|nr:hypothetical protein L3Q82_012315 [Scortum barcoo]
MPQGVTGAPATYQRLTEKAVGDMNMLQVKELSQDLRSLIVAQHQNGTGYRLISKNLSIPVSTVGAIIRKWKKHHLIINRPRTGAPRKISDQGVRKMVRRVLKEPRTNRKALQKDMEAAAKLNATGLRWLSDFSVYNFDII